MSPLLLLLGCASEPAPPPAWSERDRALLAAMALPAAPPPSPTNHVADAPAAAALGARLFTDAGLSANGQVSCATCHDPARAFTDGRPQAVAIGTGTRNTPTLQTAPWQTWFFWDGRADSAWAQATGPIRNPVEMGATAELVAARVRAAYAAEWGEVYGGVPEDPARVLAQVGKALEAFERTVPPGRSRFDDFVAALDEAPAGAGLGAGVLDDTEVRGLQLFLGPANCASCHHGPMFTDGTFHNIGLPLPEGGRVDTGRGRGAVEVLEDPYNCRGAFADRAEGGGSEDPCPELRYLDVRFDDWPGSFKTPSLRNVVRTAPYMHDGSLLTLDAVLEFYSALPGQPVVGHRELTLVPLRLDEADRAALIAFLGTLSEQAPVRPAPFAAASATPGGPAGAAAGLPADAGPAGAR